MTENELLDALDQHDELVRLCVSGKLSFKEFLPAYGDFWWSYALDGHESDAGETELLQKLESRLALHRDIAEAVLQNLVPDRDALDPQYAGAGRYGSAEAIRRLMAVARQHSITA